MIVVRTTIWEPERDHSNFWNMLRVWVRCWRHHLPEANLTVATNTPKDLESFGFDRVVEQNKGALVWRIAKRAWAHTGKLAYYCKWEPLRTDPFDHEVYCDHNDIPIARPQEMIDWMEDAPDTLLAWRRPNYEETNFTHKKHYGCFDEEIPIKGIVPGFLGMPPGYALNTSRLTDGTYTKKEIDWPRSEGGFIAWNVWHAVNMRGVTWLGDRSIALCSGNRPRANPISRRDLRGAWLVHVRHFERAQALLGILKEMRRWS